MNKKSTGNPRRTKAQWSKLISDYTKSNLTVSAYCEANHISSASFYHWRSVFRSNDTNSASSFIELDTSPALKQAVDCPPSGPAIELELGNGMTLRVYR